MIGFKDQALAPAGVRRSPELWGHEYSFPQAEGSPGRVNAGLFMALLEGTGDRRNSSNTRSAKWQGDWIIAGASHLRGSEAWGKGGYVHTHVDTANQWEKTVRNGH